VHCRRSLALAGGWLRCGPITAWPNNGAIRALGCVPRIVGNAVRALGRVALPSVLILEVGAVEVHCGMSVREYARCRPRPGGKPSIRCLTALQVFGRQGVIGPAPV
jgi:hypothetical protein